MKILFIGDCNHQLLVSFIRTISSLGVFHFSAFSITKIKIESQFLYSSVKYARSFNNIYKSKWFRKLIYPVDIFYRFLALKNDFDFIHIHSLKLQYFFIWPLLILSRKKIVISIWGSEVLRASNFRIFLLKYMYHKADFIHCTNPILIENFCQRLNLPYSKFVAIPFFLKNLKIIDEERSNRFEIKSKLGWNRGKIQCTIGYNYNSGQQHLAILDQFREIDFIDKTELILPLTYGSSDGNRETIIENAQSLSCTSVIYQSFLSERDLALIRLGTDIFINLQITDQYSASMVEALYAGSIVITGSWLPYDSLKEVGAFFVEIDKVSDLRDALSNIFKNWEFYAKRAFESKESVAKLFGEKTTFNKWDEFYKSIVD
ncbi:MAG: glycosyltransferase family 4 protein [Algoriphagus sp.]|uniref:glycosyltransferase family 4 protein n=1 Tax=Algoriphagus sp. TaxID=1872435 RepID=UPI0026117647|nr:glycosyltransferase family 4 protein [Algoriphagus sp.]MDG1278240.1 glycosyltransferase family 4 protein [Algoriphagus sp.]